MINKIKSSFEHKGYLNIKIDVEGISLYYCVVDSKVYVVSLVEDTGKVVVSKEHYGYILNHTKELFSARGFQEIEILTVACVYDWSISGEVYWDISSYWIIDMQEKRIIIYENQIGEFLNANILIQEAMDTGLIRKNMATCNNVIIGVNVLVFLIIEILGSSQNPEFLVKWGAVYWPYVVENGEYYRLFTHMFLHFGIEHLLNNMFILGFVGYQLEHVVGKGKYLIIYLTTGIIAGIASMEYNKFTHRMVVSAGASGAIFGVVGAMACVVAMNKGKVPNLSKRHMAIFIFLSLYGGFTSQQVDNVAHIGGLAAGLIVGLLCYKNRMKGSEGIQ